MKKNYSQQDNYIVLVVLFYIRADIRGFIEFFSGSGMIVYWLILFGKLFKNFTYKLKEGVK